MRKIAENKGTSLTVHKQNGAIQEKQTHQA
ncbi:DUF2188 domain-containing protein [Virgibacillus byunsanensis]|uniref:DUF2188 domain-containing protein n=1 Tax=Virgibacillus byunsanensis TaxID=570945 RepID=A0ABW3LIR6_9BACI